MDEPSFGEFATTEDIEALQTRGKYTRQDETDKLCEQEKHNSSVGRTNPVDSSGSA